MKQAQASNPNLIKAVNARPATNYRFADLIIGVTLMDGDLVTLQVKFTEPLSDRYIIDFFWDGSHYFYYNVRTNQGKDYIVVTFNWKVYGDGHSVQCYGRPSNNTPIYIEWAKLEYGDKATDFNGYYNET